MSIMPNSTQSKSDSALVKQKIRLTKRIVDAAIPAAGKDTFIWDGEIPGFGLRVTSSGAKSYVFKYREGKGRRALTRRMKIGEPPMTPDQARDIVREKHYLVSKGESPAEQEKKKRDDLTLEEVKELYMNDHALLFKKPSSIYSDKFMWEMILPELGKRKLNSITHQDIATYHRSLKDAPVQANRKIAMLSKTFNLCEEWGYLPRNSNPCHGIKKFKETRRQRYLSIPELTRLSEVLAKNERERLESPHFIALIRLLVFTGCRLNEIMQLQWDWVKLEEGRLELPDTKTGARYVILNAAALTILKSLPRFDNNPYVIVSHRRHGQCLNNPGKPWRRIRVEAGIPDVRIHDLRHTHASIGVGIGLSLPLIGALLGHNRVETTQRYAHLANDPIKAATNQVGEALGKVFQIVPATPINDYKFTWRPKDARKKETASA